MIYIYGELLYHQIYIHTRISDKIILDQKGQTLVEFILLLFVLMLTSLLFLSTVNNGTATMWERIGNMLLEDPSNRLRLVTP